LRPRAVLHQHLVLKEEQSFSWFLGFLISAQKREFVVIKSKIYACHKRCQYQLNLLQVSF